MSDTLIAFKNPEILKSAKLALPQGPNSGFICDVVSPTSFVVRDTRGKKPVDVLRVSEGQRGIYEAIRLNSDHKYDKWFRVVDGNVAYDQQECHGVPGLAHD